MIPAARLTLTAGTPVTTADVAGQTRVYYTPYLGNTIPIYDGSALVAIPFSEVSLLLDATSCHENYHQAGKLFDFFVFTDASTVRLGSAPQWASSISGASVRGEGEGTSELELLDGLWVNKHPLILRYAASCSNTREVPARQATFVGTCGMSADGQADDSKLNRLVSNAYNKVERLMHQFEGTASWVYSTATLRQTRASLANQLNVVVAIPGDLADAESSGVWSNSTSTMQTVVSEIGINQTTVGNSITRAPQACNNVISGYPTAQWRGYLPAGMNYIAWLERGAGAETQTASGSLNAGINAKVWN